MKQLALFTFLFCAFFVHAETKPKENLPEFVVLSMPKAGSHLLHKAIHRMTGLKPSQIDHETCQRNKPLNAPEYTWKYLGMTGDELTPYLKDKKVKKIVLIRDLRDIAISHIMHIENQCPGTWLDDNDSVYSALSFDQKLIYFMVQNTHYESSPRRMAKQVLKLSSPYHIHVAKDVLVCQFENLIGPQGGGSSALQKKELQKIAQFLEIPLTPCEIDKIAETLFGIDELLDYKWKRQYYRAGLVGGWKQFFTPNVLEYYDQSLAELNTKLGYK